MKTNTIIDGVLGIPLVVAIIVGYFFGPFTAPGTEIRLLLIGLIAAIPLTIVSGVLAGTRRRVASAPLAAAGYGVLAWGMTSGNLALGRWGGIGCFVLAYISAAVAARVQY